ncbi:hypothetical protein A2191_02875 [Candidatus Woesebacteria bacterium RIFOXYA1_FULL_38_9]|nr:MAG: hypothetical protein A2191_02875 [Candidatus Woesebacteria bacterium RIFOXYA1_FULL_38_9]
MKINAGITLIELLLVIAIVALLGAAATPFLSSFVLRTNFDATGQKVVSSIRKAQGYAMDGKQSQVWGCVNLAIIFVCLVAVVQVRWFLRTF